MKMQNPNVFTDAQHRIVKRWTITAAAIYGFILVGFLALVGNAAYDDSEGAPERMAINGRSEFTVPVTRPTRLSQVQISGTEATDGVGSARATMKSTRPAVVPVPEVDELGESPHSPAAQSSEILVENGWDFSKPDSIPGFGTMPQPGDAPSPDDRQLTARRNR